jgi:HD-GYP domain-containing protein (c-di-GMP phosphodiesterase class II)
MTSDRPYRRGLAHDLAINILRDYSGTQFDPRIVEIFAELLRDLVTRGAALPVDLVRAGELEVVEAE